MPKDSLKDLQELSARLAELFTAFLNSEFGKQLGTIVHNIQISMQAIEPWLQGVLYWLRLPEFLHESGWFPHDTFPMELHAESNGNPDAFRELLLEHYRNNWLAFRREMEYRLEKYEINDESKSTFVEALVAHESGLYRGVCRLLFPEIERLFRIELFGDAITGTGLSGRKMTDEVFHNEYAMENLKGPYGFAMFKLLKEYLYAHIDDEEDRQRFVNNPVPNRHAVCHGLIAYSSEQSSLNSIFISDCFFSMVSEAKRTHSSSEILPTDSH